MSLPGSCWYIVLWLENARDVLNTWKLRIERNNAKNSKSKKSQLKQYPKDSNIWSECIFDQLLSCWKPNLMNRISILVIFFFPKTFHEVSLLIYYHVWVEIARDVLYLARNKKKNTNSSKSKKYQLHVK